MLYDDDRREIEAKLNAMVVARINAGGDPEQSALLEGWEQALDWVLRTF
jgi:hypothetical protein